MNSTPGIDLKTILAGRIARAASVFCIDEIVIFDDGSKEASERGQIKRFDANGYDAKGKDDIKRDPNAFLERLLSYAECPPYLRKRLFEYHPDLGKTGLLPPLDTPHHLKADEWCQYREGVAIGPVAPSTGYNQAPRKRQKFDDTTPTSTLIDAGFPVSVPVDVPPYTRVTLKFPTATQPSNFQHITSSTWEVTEESQPHMSAEAVDPAAPRTDAGYYWGYTVRRTGCLSGVFTECPFEAGYDVSIGTSERGQDVQEVLGATRGAGGSLPSGVTHALVVFGGVAGLEVAMRNDKELVGKGIGPDNVAELFDFYVDVCPGQGSRTMRTEEALWITFARLGSWLKDALQ